MNARSAATPGAFDGFPKFFGKSFDSAHLLAKPGKLAAKFPEFAAYSAELGTRLSNHRPQGRELHTGSALAEEDEAGQDRPDGQGSDQQWTHLTGAALCSPAMRVPPASLMATGVWTSRGFPVAGRHGHFHSGAEGP